MPSALFALFAIAAPLAIPCVWIWSITRTLKTASTKSIKLDPMHWSDEDVSRQDAELPQNPVDRRSFCLSATGRRYIIVGGSGFLGGWIVRHLLLRGEDPKNIRIVNKRSPRRKDIQAEKIGFISADISNPESVLKAFTAEWPDGSNTTEGITVFHTASVMRFYERQEALISRSSGVNVDGTKNVIAASREAGADILIYTSSGSLPLRRTNFCLFPWQSCPDTMVQILSDNTPVPEGHRVFYSNYTYTKSIAEKLVQEAHTPLEGFQSGILRPGAAIFGHGDGIIFDGMLSKEKNPTWMHSTVQSVIYVENASYAHLLYESRLLECHSAPPASPLHKLGGQSFMVTDSQNPLLYGDAFRALGILTNNRIQFPKVPVAPIFFLVHLIGLYQSLQVRAPKFLPALKGEIASLQPPLLDLTLVSYKVDDSRARLAPEHGGLGYQPPWKTLQGICQLVKDHIEDPAGAVQM